MEKEFMDWPRVRHAWKEDERGVVGNVIMVLSPLTIVRGPLGYFRCQGDPAATGIRLKYSQNGEAARHNSGLAMGTGE